MKSTEPRSFFDGFLSAYTGKFNYAMEELRSMGITGKENGPFLDFTTEDKVTFTISYPRACTYVHIYRVEELTAIWFSNCLNPHSSKSQTSEIIIFNKYRSIIIDADTSTLHLYKNMIIFKGTVGFDEVHLFILSRDLMPPHMSIAAALRFGDYEKGDLEKVASFFEIKNKYRRVDFAHK